MIIKKDNKLRHFVILHLAKLINSVKNMIEIQLVTKMDKFKFTNETDDELQNLQYKILFELQSLIFIKYIYYI